MTPTFTIDRHDQDWLVEWPGLISGDSDEVKWKLLNVAFDQVKCWEVGIGCNIRYRLAVAPRQVAVTPCPPDLDPGAIAYPEVTYTENKQWFVQWISSDVWMMGDNHNERLKHHLFSSHHGREVNGILFHTLDEAELFVDKMEARLTFARLKWSYA